MEKSPFNILIDKNLRPGYYDDFECTGSNCRISCCRYWTIAFDKKDYLSLKKLRRSSELLKHTEHVMRRIKDNDNFYAEFELIDGACPLLENNGLCGLQLEQGHTALPTVCRTFPRSERYDFTGYLEKSLSPACEAVLDFLWQLPKGIDFWISALSGKEIKNLSTETSNPLISHANDIQDLCITILQDRRLPLPQRIILMGSRLKELTKENIDVSVWISKTKALIADSESILKYKSIITNDQSKMIYISNNLKTLSSIIGFKTAFKDDFMALINAIVTEGSVTLSDITFNASFDIPAYLDAEATFNKNFSGKEYFFENLMISLLFHMKIPALTSPEELWKSYVNFCNIYSFFHFVSVLSTKAQLPAPTGLSDDKASEPGSKESLFHALVIASRLLIHSKGRSNALRDEFFKNESSSLAHMAILVSG